MFEIKAVCFGLLIPAAIAMAASQGVLRTARGTAARRYALPVAIVLGFGAGFALLEREAWLPATYWHWLPWVAIPAAVLGAIGCATGVTSLDRWLMAGLAALVTGWMVVPTWKDLDPTRGTHIALYVAYVVILWAVLDWLAQRASTRALPVALSMSLLSGGVLLAALVSLRFGLMTLAAGASFACGVVIPRRALDEGLVRGMVLVYAVLAAGLLLVGRLNSPLPLASFLLVPVAPAVLALFEAGPLARLRGVAGTAARLAAVLVPLAFAIGMAAAKSLPAESAW